MTLKGAFYYHYYENFYTLSYIDKMWGLMQKEAFPRGMELQKYGGIEQADIAWFYLKGMLPSGGTKYAYLQPVGSKY